MLAATGRNDRLCKAGCRYKWTGNSLHSSLFTLKDGPQTIHVLNSSVQLRLPAQVFDSAGAGCSGACQVTTRRHFTVQGAGIAGVLIADPCFTSASITSLVGCTYGQKYQARHSQQPLPPRTHACECKDRKRRPLGCRFGIRSARLHTGVHVRTDVREDAGAPQRVPAKR